MLPFSKINSELLYIIKRFIIFIICLFFVSNLNGQKLTEFHGVELPDSVANYLETLYPDMNVSARVFNIISPNNKKWTDGIFSFMGQGPHFPRHLLISKRNNYYVFESEGFYNPEGVLKDFCACIDKLQLNNEEIILYLKEVYRYLEDEYGMDYGITIKKEE